MPEGLYGEFLTTLGIEIEGQGITRNSLSDALSEKLSKYYPEGFPFTITRDASTEMVAELIPIRGTSSGRYMQVFSHNKLFRQLAANRAENKIVHGYELVINPMTLEDMKPLLVRLINTIIMEGDFVSERCATHYHIGFAHNLRLMKKLLAVCLRVEPLLFRLGGMGKVFRGHSNLAAYARPLLNSSAVPIGREIQLRVQRQSPETPRSRPNYTTVSDEERDEMERTMRRAASNEERRVMEYVRVSNPLKALEAKTTKEFWSCFGVFPEYLGLNKYHPVRYTACNFYAIAQHGTMEFRHFNQSHDPELIYIIGKLLRGMVEMSTMLTKSDINEFSPMDSNKEITMSEAEETLSLLERFMKMKEVENIPTNAEYTILLDTLESSHFESLPDKPVLSHNNEFSIPANLAGNLVKVTNPLQPKHVDIHTIKDSSILGDI
jgi:hypothetical protein